MTSRQSVVFHLLVVALMLILWALPVDADWLCDGIDSALNASLGRWTRADLPVVFQTLAKAPCREMESC